MSEAMEAMEAEAPDAEPALRSRILRDLGDVEGDRSSLDAFMAEGTSWAALTEWFGADRMAQAKDPRQIRRWLDREIAEIDDVLSRACNTILHHSKFQELEGAWRGVHWLTGELSADGLTRLRILDCRWSELARDMERAAEFDLSVLFDLVYNQEFGMPGGVPFSLLVGLYEVQHRPTRGHPTDDVAVLRRLAGVGAAAFSTILLGASPTLLGVDDFRELDRRASISAPFRSAEYTRFNSFRSLSDSRFIGLVAPRVLLRAPYRGRAVGDCGFNFQETVEDSSRDQVWGVGALALAHICLRAFNDYRWLAAIRGTIQDELAGGVITGLPTPDFETDAPDTIVKFPLEVNITESLERELTEAGIVTIRRCKDTPFTAIANLPSAHKPKGAYLAETAKLNEQLGAMLNYILCVGRFAHYIKVIAREWIGSYKSAAECEGRLTRWLAGYCTTGDDMTYELRARYPLHSAQVTVQEVPGKPGSFECVAHLKPHLQLDQAISEFQLVTVIQGVERQL